MHTNFRGAHPTATFVRRAIATPTRQDTRPQSSDLLSEMRGRTGGDTWGRAVHHPAAATCKQLQFALRNPRATSA